jgi:hypothetical protein
MNLSQQILTKGLLNPSTSIVKGNTIIDSIEIGIVQNNEPEIFQFNFRNFLVNEPPTNNVENNLTNNTVEPTTLTIDTVESTTSDKKSGGVYYSYEEDYYKRISENDDSVNEIDIKIERVVEDIKIRIKKEINPTIKVRLI